MSLQQQMMRLVDSSYRLAALETSDSERVVDLFRAVARDTGKAVYQWTPEVGMNRLGSDHILIPETARPRDALNYIASTHHFAVYLLRDFAPALDDPRLANQLRPIVTGEVPGARRLVVLLGQFVDVPRGMRHHAVRVRHNLRQAS